jgi:hypothetical protein
MKEAIDMARYTLVKILCIILIAAAIAAGGYFTYNYVVSYHHSHLITTHNELNPPPEPDIKMSVSAAGEAGSPYDIDGILAFYNGYKDNTLSIKITATNNIAAELLYITNEKENIVYPFAESTFLEPAFGTPEYDVFDFYVDDSFAQDLGDIFIKYQYDDGTIRAIPMIPYTLGEYAAYDSTLIRTRDNISDFDFVSVDGSSVSFDGESITLDRPLFIPEGLVVEFRKGQQIDLINEAFIVSYSPVMSIGSDTDGILMHTSDGTGRGIFICQSQDKSSFSYTTFDGLDCPQSGIWVLTGAVTFYESDVDISHCTFTNNKCEDGLNIVRSDFSIKDSFFSNTFGDAFDSDFSTGTMSGCAFSDTGNDAVDVSTTQLTIRDMQFKHIGDKAVSGGERSTIIIESADIDDATIGIASKDMSDISCKDISISDTMVALTLYQKKPEFGPGSIVGEDITLSGNISMDYLIEKKSTLIIDGIEIFPRSDTKESILFDKMINGEPLR